MADEQYAAVTRELRRLTRDRKRFPLVYRELTNYGFARNLYGCKPLGLTISGVVLFASLAGGYARAPEIAPLSYVQPPWIWGIVSSTLMSIAWLMVTKATVKAPADAYANAIVEALSTLAEAGSEVTHAEDED